MIATEFEGEVGIFVLKYMVQINAEEKFNN